MGSLICIVVELYLSSGDQLDVSGSRARTVLTEYWPSDLVSDSIRHAYVHTEGGIDTCHTFIKMNCNQEVADKWDQHLARRWEFASISLASRFDVNTKKSDTVATPGSEIPSWWSDPTGKTRSYEICGWYRDGYSAWGYGTYLAYDLDTNTLWIYDYNEQHDRLLPRPSNR